MKMKNAILLFLLLAALSVTRAQTAPVDTSGLGRIKYEALNNPKAFETLSYLCNVFGPRLMRSPEYKTILH